MTAFQRHRAVDVLPLTFSIPTFLPAVLGLVVLRENFATAVAGGSVLAVGSGLLVVGAVAVARSAPAATVQEHAVSPGNDPRRSPSQ